MYFRLAADSVLLLHLAFILFTLLGAAMTVWRRWVPFVHLPAAAWGGFVELTGRVCPLTYFGELPPHQNGAVWLHRELHRALSTGYYLSFRPHTRDSVHACRCGLRRQHHNLWLALLSPPRWAQKRYLTFPSRKQSEASRSLSFTSHVECQLRRKIGRLVWMDIRRLKIWGG